MWLVVGLGNPGNRYSFTRHNVGFMVADNLAMGLKAGSYRESCHSLVAESDAAREKVVLAKPMTFMNLSGKAVSLCLDKFSLHAENLIVVHDDIDLDFGRVKIRDRGGHGGHNGMRSIMREIDNREFLRIKIGIGRPPEGVDPADYVLSRFRGEEENIVGAAVEKAAEAVMMIVEEGPVKAMNRFNG